MAKINFVYSITDSNTAAAIGGVHVWASSDQGGKTVLASGTTEPAAGTVVFSLEVNTDVYFWAAKSGYLADALPDNETVTASNGSGTMTSVVAAVPDSVTQVITCLDLIDDALMECGILAQGEEGDSNDVQLAFRRLNQLIEQWNVERKQLYQIKIASYTLTANQTTHTIGPSGNLLADRPDKIVRANIILSGVHYPVGVIERAEEWAQVSMPTISAGMPSEIYCDYAYPDATLYLYLYPDAAYTLELFTWQRLTQFKNLTDSVLFPPGYYPALMESLAEEICIPFGTPADVHGRIMIKAAKARAKIQKKNITAPRISLANQGIPSAESL